MEGRGIHWLRPLLSVPRADLRDYLRGQGMDWVDDPTNDDDSYTRVKARRALKGLQELGITAARLSAVSGHLDMARRALRWQVAEVTREAIEEAGALRIGRDRFLALPLEVQRRFLIAALRWISGAEYPPRENGLDAVQRAIAQGKDATLGGCRFRCRGDEISLLREARALVGLQGLVTELWDGRWQVEGPSGDAWVVRALGAAGLEACKGWRDTGISREVLLTTPAIWRDGQLIAAPIAEKSAEWTAKIGLSFKEFVLSH